MSVNGTKTVTFYHSVVCPRCQLSGLLLERALRKYPDVQVTKVEYGLGLARRR